MAKWQSSVLILPNNLARYLRGFYKVMCITDSLSRIPPSARLNRSWFKSDQLLSTIYFKKYKHFLIYSIGRLHPLIKHILNSLECI